MFLLFFNLLNHIFKEQIEIEIKNKVIVQINK